MDDHSDPHDPVAAFAARNTPPNPQRWKPAVYVTIVILIVGTVWPFLWR